MAKKLFSTQLTDWLENDDHKTIGELQEIFGEKSFAILILLFMSLPALPLPTGGITHAFLLPVVMLVSLQMIFGRRTLWLPERVNRIPLGEKTLKKALPFIVRRVRQLEKFARPRKSYWFDKASFRTIIGLSVLLMAIAAFISPLFSGLDTLPGMGAVLIALSIILEDIAFYFVGLFVGTVGIGLLVAAGKLVLAFLKHLF